MTPLPRPKNLPLFGSQVFNGERLRQAREAQGLTATTLAERIGKSKQAISRYENGVDLPSGEVILALAAALEQPVQFFSDPFRADAHQSITFYRRLKRVTGPELRRANAWRSWLEDFTLFLEEYVAFPKEDVPDSFSFRANYDLLDLNIIDSIALDLRRHWRLGIAPIEHLTRTVERHGFLVSRFDVGADDIDAYSFRARNGRGVIALNDYKVNHFRSRFDLAHELGHLLLHGDVKQKDLDDAQKYERLERQAHRFAAALLLPAEPLLADVYSLDLDALLLLKQKWGVSIGAILYRLMDLDIISRDDHERLRRSMSRRGWIKREPLDFSTDPEDTSALRQAVNTLIQDADFAKNDIPHDLVRSPETVRRLANLHVHFFKEPEEVEVDLHQQYALHSG
ncbi:MULTISPECIES: XRE family transcriptional regulator [Deinococcus]|uniref:ImmA/IrrE family metallo-endopeptidase n=2 Tax=Deinococcus TaxID=1298 RepID=A0A6I4YBY1_9DEIO|nr:MULTISPECIES: XRE family transcriptional regulator [Deinococcus]MXV18942.1 ImmA/IrrE family metallo-endopeptidase [Deinococcus xianganensis]BBN93865.1 transcriptional regulator [Deinococcus grandis]GAQ22628.1 putative Zn peptidase [Deinococcus grandis]